MIIRFCQTTARVRGDVEALAEPSPGLEDYGKFTITFVAPLMKPCFLVRVRGSAGLAVLMLHACDTEGFRDGRSSSRSLIKVPDASMHAITAAIAALFQGKRRFCLSCNFHEGGGSRIHSDMCSSQEPWNPKL